MSKDSYRSKDDRNSGGSRSSDRNRGRSTRKISRRGRSSDRSRGRSSRQRNNSKIDKNKNLKRVAIAAMYGGALAYGAHHVIKQNAKNKKIQQHNNSLVLINEGLTSDNRNIRGKLIVEKIRGKVNGIRRNMSNNGFSNIPNGGGRAYSVRGYQYPQPSAPPEPSASQWRQYRPDPDYIGEINKYPYWERLV